MKKLTLALVAILGFAATPAMADIDYGLEVGIRQQSGDVKSGSTDSQMGLQFGATVHAPLSGPWHLRTGMLYTQRPLVVKATPDNKVTMNYLDIPVALMYKFEEGAGVYAGISLAMNLDKKADSGTVEDVKSPMTPFILGATFKFAENLGAGIYYETASGEAAKNLENYRAVGANLMITFD
ncbi:hypothetical protein AZI86_08055 [Bdellovibrio bacteriovorus]|uniref:Outer membrane protein beta-barrel domain-containing protein n=1 Tax=Bdellovibrio bacteriovorus TaxID=959 RepID=A0A150WRF5_BDEBC|nr:outer membrane beta-barrel protein [Bdellovibrio bacteriovorus]KYG66966.1 hypothetical protein AZI86_08055 [Bdellovibrio bacteriovorus]